MVRPIRLLALLAVLALALAACGPQPAAPPTTTSLIAGDGLAPVTPALISGPIAITGSSTVYPLTARIVEDFAAEGSPAQIEIKITGTGGGFRSFCNGDPVDLVNASRLITAEESAACQAAGREPLGFQVGVDALAVVVSNQNAFLETITFAQLAQIFSGQVRRWNELDPTFPDAPIAIFSPGVDSGTFDYFVEEVLGGDEALIPAIPNVVLSESDTELLQGIENDPNAIGYFGYAYYQNDQERLRALAVDGGSGAIIPNAETVSQNSYPLARPLLIYVDARQLDQSPAAAAFVSYYLQTVGEVVADVGYFPIPEATISQAQRDLVAALR